MLKAAIIEVLTKYLRFPELAADEIIAAIDALDAPPEPGTPPLDALIHNIVPTDTPLLALLNRGTQS
jgi:hypothetical protein